MLVKCWHSFFYVGTIALVHLHQIKGKIPRIISAWLRQCLIEQFARSKENVLITPNHELILSLANSALLLYICSIVFLSTDGLPEQHTYLAWPTELQTVLCSMHTQQPSSLVRNLWPLGKWISMKYSGDIFILVLKKTI